MVSTTAPAAGERHRRGAMDGCWRDDDALGRSARRTGDSCTRGSVRHKGARGDPMRVLSQDRVDRWRASSGQTPSSVTRAGVETTAACAAKARDGKGRRFATERSHCQLFRGFRAGSSPAFNAACTGPFRSGTQRTSRRVRHACMLTRRLGRDDPASAASR